MACMAEPYENWNANGSIGMSEAVSAFSFSAVTLLAGTPSNQGNERPAQVREQVEKVITAIRPAIQADQGDISLIDVDESTGLVTVELHGACVTCPASTQTLKAGIERIMKDRVDGVTEVVEINALGMSESPVQL